MAFYGLTKLPAEFQKAIDHPPSNFESIFACFDYHLIVTKGHKDTHKEVLHKLLKKLNEKKLAISLEKRKFACEQA